MWDSDSWLRLHQNSLPFTRCAGLACVKFLKLNSNKSKLQIPNSKKATAIRKSTKTLKILYARGLGRSVGASYRCLNRSNKIKKQLNDEKDR